MTEAAHGSFEELEMEFIAKEEGYLVAYTSNQTNEDLNVFMDDMTVTHTTGPIVRVDDYYPFGLTFNSSKLDGKLTNKFLYNGKEKEELTDWYDYGARMYDAAIGRWHLVDNKAHDFKSYSPYNYCLNNPIYHTDPDGNGPIAFVFYELRGAIPLIESLGLTAAFAGSVMLDLETGEVGAGFVSSAGISGGMGVFYGPGAGLFWDSEASLDDLQGLGGNTGFVWGLPTSSFSVEGNVTNPFVKEKKYGINTGLPTPVASGGAGIAGYVELSATTLTKFGSIYEATQYMINNTVEKIDYVLDFYEKYPLLMRDPFLSAKLEGLKKLKTYILENEDVIHQTVESNIQRVKEFYNSVKSDEQREENVQSNKNENSGKYNQRSSDSNYSDEFLKWWYDE